MLAAQDLEPNETGQVVGRDVADELREEVGANARHVREWTLLELMREHPLAVIDEDEDVPVNVGPLKRVEVRGSGPAAGGVLEVSADEDTVLRKLEVAVDEVDPEDLVDFVLQKQRTEVFDVLL